MPGIHNSALNLYIYRSKYGYRTGGTFVNQGGQVYAVGSVICLCNERRIETAVLLDRVRNTVMPQKRPMGIFFIHAFDSKDTLHR